MDFSAPDKPSGRLSGKKRPLLVSILGSTASGKSSIALKLAGKFGFEIVNCDSRQVYREMIIGTACPTKEEREAVPHHLFDFIPPDRKFSAGDYSRHARECLSKIWKDNRKPLLVGGTGFYFEALTKGLSDYETDPAIRSKVQGKLESEGLQSLVDELSRLDPHVASIIETRNPRRVTRALEMVYQTGLTLNEIRRRQESLNAECLTFIVTLPRNILRRRIELRVDRMIAGGLEEEARMLLEKFGEGAPGMKSIGYSEWKPVFQGGVSREVAITQIKTHTSQYAKRQETWFRNRTQGIRFDLSSENAEMQIINQIQEFCDLP